MQTALLETLLDLLGNGKQTLIPIFVGKTGLEHLVQKVPRRNSSSSLGLYQMPLIV